MDNSQKATVGVEDLLHVFYDHPTQLGQFHAVPGSELTDSARELLDHNHHMTVTVERFHGASVTVEILQSRTEGPWYSREILLRRTSDDSVVQYGIVRLNLTLLARPVRDEILAGEKPLGRILIERQVMRAVRLVQLYRIEKGPVLDRWLMAPSPVCYGRTAVIYCDAVPAIELLEVVAG